MGLLNLTIYILLTGAIIYERSQSFHPKAKQKIIIVSLAAGVSFLCLFLLFGFLQGRFSLAWAEPIFYYCPLWGIISTSIKCLFEFNTTGISLHWVNDTMGYL